MSEEGPAPQHRFGQSESCTGGGGGGLVGVVRATLARATAPVASRLPNSAAVSFA